MHATFKYIATTALAVFIGVGVVEIFAVKFAEWGEKIAGGTPA